MPASAIASLLMSCPRPPGIGFVLHKEGRIHRTLVLCHHRICGRLQLALFSTFLTTAWPEPRPVRSFRGESSRAQNRQDFASPSYLAFPQSLHNPQIRRSGFPVSKHTHAAPRLSAWVARGPLLLLRKSGPELAGVARQHPQTPIWSPGVHCFWGGVLPWCRTRFEGTASAHRSAVTRTDHRRRVSEDVARETFCSACPQESGATIPGTQRRPGQTHTRARGTIEARPPTRHTPPATKNYQKAAQFSSFRVPRSGIETHSELTNRIRTVPTYRAYDKIARVLRAAPESGLFLMARGRSWWVRSAGSNAINTTHHGFPPRYPIRLLFASIHCYLDPSNSALVHARELLAARE